MIDTAKLGKTGINVSRLGYGSMGLRGPKTWGVRVVDDETAEQVLHAVLDAGINFIDTAPDYGVTEERIGRFISSRRNEFVLATKCGCDCVQRDDHLEIRHTWTADVVERNLTASLDRMQTDHIDILQFHGGNARELESAGLIDLLVDFRRQGLIRHIGVSSKLPEIEDLIDLDVFETFQIPYSCLSPEHHKVISRASSTGAGVIIRGGIAHGGPDAEIDRPQLRDVWNQARLDDLIPSGMTRAELILRYTLSHPDVDTTIVGTCNREHLQENLHAAAKGSLPLNLYDEITRRVAKVLVHS